MRKRAFTLTELLVAISIIAILISVSMPAGKVAKGAANQFVATNAIGTLQMSTSTYCSDSDETLPLAISQKSFEPMQTCLGTQTGKYQFDEAQSLLEPYFLGMRNKDPIFKAKASFGDSSVLGYWMSLGNDLGPTWDGSTYPYSRNAVLTSELEAPSDSVSFATGAFRAVEFASGNGKTYR